MDIIKNMKIYNSVIHNRHKYEPERLERIAYADENTERYLDFLREDILSNALPPEGLYGGRMTEFELNKYLKEHIPPIIRAKNLSKAELDALETYHIYKIEGSKNSYRGPKTYSDIKMLKHFKLKFIPTDCVINDVIRNEDQDKLVEYIKNMQSDNVYIGCETGIDDTNIALLINQYFNPLCKDTKTYYNKYGDNTFYIFEDLCDKLTPEQKKEMAWTQEFEMKFREKIEFKKKQQDKYWSK